MTKIDCKDVQSTLWFRKNHTREMDVMRKLTALTVLLCATTTFADDSSVKDATKSATSSVISFGKNLLGGMTDGVTDGRTSSQGADGALSVSNREELAEHVDVKLLRLFDQDESKVVAEMGFYNQSDEPISIINLDERAALIMIDKDGFSHTMPDAWNADKITIPENAAVKRTFTFQGRASEMAKVRLWGVEYEPTQK
jgi:hypothetical protein